MKKRWIIAVVISLLLVACSKEPSIDDYLNKEQIKEDMTDQFGSVADEISTQFNETTDEVVNGVTSSVETMVDTMAVNAKQEEHTILSYDGIPEYSGKAWIEINNNIPSFNESGNVAYELYSNLDNLGRPGTAMACIGPELMPSEERGEIGMVKPAGWHTTKYEDLIEDLYLYNRCHLIGYQLTGQNANEKNLITGTRYLNIDGMLEHENMVADYIRKTGNHVLYRVTPVYVGNELLCRGLQLEAKSVEDDYICFNIFAYNVQPGIVIDYATGDSHRADQDTSEVKDYVLNVHTMKFHLPTCDAAAEMSENNKQNFKGNRDELIKLGYTPCGGCNP